MAIVSVEMAKENVPGKSSRKALTVSIQAGLVAALVNWALVHFDVPNPQVWFTVLVPALTGALHGLVKWVPHAFGFEIHFDIQDVPGVKYLPVLLCGLLLVGCATARTDAIVRTQTEDGFVEEVEFSNKGVVTWGSSQELQRGDLDYTWGTNEHFKAGGSATNQQSVDPVTAITADLLRTLIDRAIPAPSPTVPQGANASLNGRGEE